MSDTVDVIIPTRDRLALTRQAVDSVLAQTHGAWRGYIVDDASQPDARAGLEDLCASDTRLQLVTRASAGGPQAARQSGLEAGESPWVATLDSDDVWEPRRLEAQLHYVAGKRLEGVQIDAVMAGYTWIDDQGEVVGGSPERPRQLHNQLWLTNNFSTLLLSRSTLASVGGFLPPGQPPLRTCENLELCLRLTGVWHLQILPDVLARCRVHDGPRASDAVKTRAAADELARVLTTHADILAGHPNIWADLEAQTGARYLAVGQLSDGMRLMTRALRRADRQRARRLLRRYGPFAAHAVVKAGRTRVGQHLGSKQG